MQHSMTRKQHAVLGVVALSLAGLAAACGDSGTTPADPAPSTAGSPSNVGGGGTASGGVPQTMTAGTGGTSLVNSTAGGGSGGTGSGTGGNATGGTGTAGNGGSGGMGNPGHKPKVLFLSGANHHNWLVQDPYLINILKSSKLFESVTYELLPAATDDASWAVWRPKWTDYDVVVHNLDLFHSNFGRDWPDQVKRDFEAYMQAGGGLATLHAGTHGWENWDEYNKMTGGGWRAANFGCSLEIVGGKQTIVPLGVGPAASDVPFTDQLIHVLDPQNPITKGLPPVWKIITDNSSVYQRGPCETVTVLDYAYSKTGGIDGSFPVSWTNQYHQGRFFFIAPMHVMADLAAVHEADDVGFQTMWIRGVEWAATAKVTYPVPANFPTETTISRNDLSNFK